MEAPKMDDIPEIQPTTTDAVSGEEFWRIVNERLRRWSEGDDLFTHDRRELPDYLTIQRPTQ